MNLHDLMDAAGKPKRPAMTVFERDAECTKHGAIVERGISLFGGEDRVIWHGCGKCNAELRDRDEATERAAEEKRRQARIEQRIQAAGIPSAFRDRTLDNFETATPEQEHALNVAREFVANFYRDHLPNGTVLVFGGNPGTGKSHLALAILQQVMKRHTGMYLDAMSLIRRVRATWRRDSPDTEDDVITTLGEQLDLLAIDEIGVQRGTEDEQAIMFDVLNRRYRENRPTILLTNLDGPTLKEFMGPRIMDRLRERADFVPFKWESYRKQPR
ncbi:ATP-binding protein [Paraburkholderia hospita]|uniref:ATP-binding protein n=1 Tax=Paraburkholderia hospita TaxID=169430 RepID=UPI0008A7BDA0|nr:ATP-binding protein [Paraburkholderia hospita]SEH89317.1 phage DNA replication protein (predicted replicative helicase loader) [Paraburkholderia hospita]